MSPSFFMELMMKYIMAFLVILSVNLAAQSVETMSSENTFTQRGYCEINAGDSATCEICNYESYRPIRCQMSIRGKTLYGLWFQGSQYGAIAYGQCMYGYVYANNPMRDPLISAEASATCSRYY